METQNIKTITLDLRQVTKEPIPNFVQSDTNILQFEIKEAGANADLSDIDNIVANFQSSKGNLTMRSLAAVGNVVTYEFGDEEQEDSGFGELSISFFKAGTRLSTKTIRVFFEKTVGEFFRHSKGMPLLQELFVEVSNTNEMLLDTNNTIQANEAIRIDNENIRQNQEAQRELDTANAITNMTDTVDAYLDEVSFIEEYNSTTNYAKNNMVGYLGNTYIAKQANVGQIPTGFIDDVYWAKISTRGRDGVGSVSIKSHTFVATENQTVFVLPFTYEPHENKVKVIISGVQQAKENFTETNDTTVTLTEGVDVGTQVIVEVFSTEFDDRIAEFDAVMIEMNDSLDAINTTNSTASANELERVASENTRISSEITRETNEEARQLTKTAMDTLITDTKYIEPYNAVTTYKKNNIVSYNGSSYIAKQTTKGNTPTDLVTDPNWGILSRKGTDGNAVTAIYKDTFTATEGQTTFTLSYSYDQYQNRTAVLLDGVLQRTPEHYEEAGNNVIIFNEGLSAGSVVEVKYFAEAIPLTDDVRTVVTNHTTEINKFNNQSLYTEDFVATEGQSVFTLQNEYDQLQHKVEVYVDGVLQDSGDNYTESANNQISLTEGVPAGTEVSIKYIGRRLPVTTDVEATLNTHSSMLIDLANKDFLQQDTEPVNAEEGTLWLDTSDNAFQGTVFQELDNTVKNHTDQLAQNARYIEERGISVKKFGVKGDGITDDTLKIQEAVDYCAANKLVLVFPMGTYIVSTILPKQGILGFQSYGAVLKANSKAGEGVLASNLSTKVNDYFIDGFSIDCNDLGRRGIFCYGNNIRITNNNIYGLNSPANSQQGIRFFKSSSYNTVKNNTITLGIDTPFGTFPSLEGIAFVGVSSSIYAGLDAGNDIVQGTEICMNNYITDNVIEGGTHGIHLNTADKNVVSGNMLKNQTHRNIILSPLASYNTVNNNQCLEFGSAAIHMAYGSSYNMVSGNNIYSSGTIMIADSGGEGAIQSYVHSKNNTIIGNSVYTKSTKYGIYSAIHCNGLVVKNNVVEGGIKASIAVESDWSETLLAEELYARTNYGSPPNPAWTSWDNGKKFEYITIKDNTIQRLTIGTMNCGIYIGQSKSAEMNSLVIDGNVISSFDNSGDDFYVYVNDDTKFNQNIIRANTITPLEIAQVEFTNPNIRLSSYEQNNWQNRIVTVSTATNTLDITKSNYIVLNAVMTINAVSGLMVSSSSLSPRIITVKLSNGVVLTHNTSIMRLKGDTNISATSGNQIVTFLIVSGILFEVSRNF